jgi:hypothetical protein
MLADQLAEAIPDFGTAVVSVLAIYRPGRKLLRLPGRRSRFGKRPDFLDRADADAVGLAQGPVDRPGFGHAHLGAVDQGRDIGRIGIAIAEKSATRPRLEDCGSEYPSRGDGIARFQDWTAMDSGTTASVCEPKQSRMGNVPAPVEVFDISASHRNLMPLDQLPEGTQNRLGQVSVK